ncbi:MAG: DUF4270 family protein [Bacteroidetes bacterium]|nr:DUF4270 family protein [Bacteroidota bacterium]
MNTQKRVSLTVFSLIIVAFAWYSCTKPTAFGSDLLSGDAVEADFTDTITVNFTVLREDSTITSDLSSTTSLFLCGQLNDPIFGTSKAEIFSLMNLSILDPGFDSSRHKLDSVVLYLAYNASGVYGDTTQAFNLKVFQLDRTLGWDSSYYSRTAIPASKEIGGIDQFYAKPNTKDSLFVSSTRAAFIRVPLTKEFGESLLYMDSLSTTDDTLFYLKFHGLKIEVTPANGTLPGGMLAFNLNDANYSRMRLYFKQDDTLKSTYDYYFEGCNKFSRFVHNYTGSQAGAAIKKPAENLLYVQGMNGLRLKMELPYIDKLKNIVVNDADLVLTTATLNDDIPVLSNNPVSQMVNTYSVGDTLYYFSEDVNYSIGITGANGFSLFGGYPETEVENGVTLTRYRMALSDRLQHMIEESPSDPHKKVLYLNVYPQNRSAMRAIFYGPKSPVFPAKIALKYTKLK